MGAFGSRDAGKKGGQARAKALTAEQRSAIARNAVEARWSKAGKLKEVARATHGSPDHPLRIGEIEIPCYVLSDGRRVLTQQGMMKGLKLSKTGGDPGREFEGVGRMARFAAGKSVSPYISDVLRGVLSHPIHFKLQNGTPAYGYEATVLADLCEAVLRAKDAGVLMHQQAHVAAQCEILLRGFARVGIVALVDEATGYQADRARDALAKILEAFVAKELRAWVKTFPTDFYKELFRLRGIPYTTSPKKPAYIGHLTNDLVYSRLAPGVLKELRTKNPKSESGRRKVKHHQWLTAEIGHPKLLQHLSAVIALMRVSGSWSGLMEMLDKALPKQVSLPLFDDDDAGAGETIADFSQGEAI